MSFDSFEQMQSFMKEQQRLADENVTDEQRAITYGDHWVRYDPHSGLVIFGAIDTLDGMRERMRSHGMSDDEIAEDVASTEEMHPRGYRFGYCWSIACPEGELGSTHVSVMRRIEREQFEMARDLFSWQWDEMLTAAANEQQQLSRLLAIYGSSPRSNTEARQLLACRERCAGLVWVAAAHKWFRETS